MAKSVFSVSMTTGTPWRVQQTVNMGELEGQTILALQEWEEVRRQGDPAIEKWIATRWPTSPPSWS